MSTASEQTPAIPPRPSRDGAENNNNNKEAPAMPKIPPRPAAGKRIDRSVSPGADRFAPSPLNDALLQRSPRVSRSSLLAPQHSGGDPIERSSSVDLPTIGQEGQEYAAVAPDHPNGDGDEPPSRSSSPEHTRVVGSDLKLHAPRPSLPADSAKRRVAAVTRTDSDRAASFGIGRPSLDGPVLPSNRSLKKKVSAASQLSNGTGSGTGNGTATDDPTEDEQGIPEIGQQVPMYPGAGDVQAPSPAPSQMAGGAGGAGFGPKPLHHRRKGSARSFAEELPPGSYGLHGHGVESTDRLEQAYYEKHPELRKLEHHPYQHDRPHDFSMSSDALNKIVRETAAKNSALGSKGAASSTPSEHIGWQAIEETTSRSNSPHPKSRGNIESSARGGAESNAAASAGGPQADDKTIHIQEPRGRSSHIDEPDTGSRQGGVEDEYETPILAEDEVAKSPYLELTPAVHPEHRPSGYDIDRPVSAHSRPTSRPTSRPASLYKAGSNDHRSTPLENVKEYEPLFPDEEPATREARTAALREQQRRFPSRDVWEDAPNSVHYTTEVSKAEEPETSEADREDPHRYREVPSREANETPAQAFARQQELLAEKESKDNPEGFLHRKQKAIWAQQHRPEGPGFPADDQKSRFPSRDIWEDSPDSLQLSATVSTPQQQEEEEEPSSPVVDQSGPTIPAQRLSQSGAEESRVGQFTPESAQRYAREQEVLAEKEVTTGAAGKPPAIPSRPKPKATPSNEGKPMIPDRPKPQIPARPGAGAGVEKQKPAVPARPMGSKISALQAGFMSDLNKRLQLGPHAPKREQSSPSEETPQGEDAAAPKEKVPLTDARKTRARGPQRRAPPSATKAAEATAPAESAKATLGFSIPCTIFTIDPEEGLLSVETKAVDEDEPAKEEEQQTAHDSAPTVQQPAEDKAASLETTSAQTPAAVTGDEEVGAAPEAEEKTETLASNTAGEAVAQAVVAEDKEHHVEPEEVKA